MKNTEDAPWHLAKQELAEALKDLTLLWQIGPQKRSLAHGQSIREWDDDRVSAATFGMMGPGTARVLDAVISINRCSKLPPVLPRHVQAGENIWRNPHTPEVFVDFETVTDLADDFSRIPERGGTPLIFMIGCGRNTDVGWVFRQFVVTDLTSHAEGAVIDEWLAYLQEIARLGSVELSDVRLYHWSAAETTFLDNAYNSASARHPERAWPLLGWYDLLQNVARDEPLTVRGAFGFGLKSIARALHSHGLIKTIWRQSQVDGLGAMVGAWWCASEARRAGLPLEKFDLMQEIADYNEVDCRVMAEVVRYLRDQH